LTPRKRYSIPLPNGWVLELGERTLVMGILNITPDSFADGGLRFDAARAVDDGLRMIEDGADILDVGGESTRPGAEPLPADEELRRVLPVIEKLADHARVPLSVDTYKEDVAREAVARGASIVNDISSLQYEERLAQGIAETGAALVLMHNRGRSRDMYREAHYDDVAAEIAQELSDAMSRAVAAGVRREAIVLDPGIGFSKRSEHSIAVLSGLPRLTAMGYPVLIGVSRKRFIGELTGIREAAQRVHGTTGANVMALAGGARIFRVHDVAAARQALDVAWAILQRETEA
jgi:dihydropteroate synthase